jgi:mitosis inhibitor protein kinase SWE1
VPIGLGVTTPSPTSGMGMIYPFASSTWLKALHTPPSSDLARSSDGPISSPLDKLMALPGRLRDLTGAGGPIARASNPMLAASYKAHRSSAPPGPTGAAKRIAGRLERDFVLLQSLGSGEFSQVWKVRDKKHGRLWAVKAGKPYTGYTNRYPKLHGLDCLLTWGSLRQLEEVSILRNLSVEPHPHVIDFIDSWEHNDRLFIRTELAECGDLSRFLLSLGDYAGMGEAQVWKTLVELSSGLRHIHGQNVLHLDIKPSNILITYAGSLKIADFGVSTILGPEGYAADLSPALPSTGQDGGFVWTDRQAVGLVRSPILDREVEGDREYLSPEALGDGQVGREADVFS